MKRLVLVVLLLGFSIGCGGPTAPTTTEDQEISVTAENPAPPPPSSDSEPKPSPPDGAPAPEDCQNPNSYIGGAGHDGEGTWLNLRNSSSGCTTGVLVGLFRILDRANWTTTQEEVSRQMVTLGPGEEKRVDFERLRCGQWDTFPGLPFDADITPFESPNNPDDFFVFFNEEPCTLPPPPPPAPPPPPPPPPPGEQGCTLGYWKTHLGSWVGYSPSQTVQSVFSKASGYAAGSATLLEALSFPGGPGAEGGARILLRGAVAALLSAAHPGVNYPRSLTSVISDVNLALASGNRNTMIALAEALDKDNNLGCPLN